MSWWHLMVWLLLVAESQSTEGWLFALPFIGVVFDLVPSINWIPLVPTILNIL